MMLVAVALLAAGILVVSGCGRKGGRAASPDIQGFAGPARDEWCQEHRIVRAAVLSDADSWQREICRVALQLLLAGSSRIDALFSPSSEAWIETSLDDPVALMGARSYCIATTSLSLGSSTVLSRFGFSECFCEKIRLSSDETIIAWIGIRDAQGGHAERRLFSHVVRALQEGIALRAELAMHPADCEASAIARDVCHDLRAPVSNMKAILHLCLLESDPEETRRFIDKALACADDLDELIDNLIEVQTANFVPEPEPFRIDTLLERLTDQFLWRARAKNVALELRMDSSCVGRTVLGDRQSLTRIVSNLMSNAIKFTVKGRVQVDISRHGETVSIAVEDTGPGLHSHEVPEIFKPFTRFHRRQAEGSGIGLAVVAKLCDQNGWSVSAESSLGVGSVFRISHISIAEETLPRIVLIDDNRIFAESLKRALGSLHYAISVCASVAEARELLAHTVASAVISDYELSDGNFLTILPLLDQVPVLLLTGRDPRLLPPLPQEAVSIMTKPVDIGAVGQWVEAAVGRLQRAA